MQYSSGNTQDRAVNYALYVGLALMGVLVVLSFVYWQERTLYLDSSFQLFEVINRRGLAIQVQRFGAAIVQGPALLFAKYNAPLATIMKVFSMAFTVYPLIFALIVWKLLKNPRLALVITLFFMVTQVHTFFWIQSEQIQGCMYSLLLMAIVVYNANPKWWQFLIWQPFIVLVVYIHPLVILPFLFLWAWHFLELKSTHNWKYASILLSMGITLFYKYKMATVGAYDNTAMGMLDGFWERLPDLFNFPGTQFLGRRLKSTYYLMPLLLVINLVAMGYKKHWLKMALMLTAIIGWLLLVLVSLFYSIDQMYMESYYLTLGLFLVVPFVYEAIPARRNLAFAGMIVVFSIVRVFQIIDVHQLYEARLDWTKAQLAKMNTYPEKRFYIKKEDTPIQMLGLNWGTAYETIMLSSLAGPEHSKTLFIAENDDQIREVLELKDAVKSPFGSHPFVTFNTTYFNFQDTLPPRQLTNQ